MIACGGGTALPNLHGFADFASGGYSLSCCFKRFWASGGMADAGDLKSPLVINRVRVRVPPRPI